VESIRELYGIFDARDQGWREQKSTQDWDLVAETSKSEEGRPMKILTKKKSSRILYKLVYRRWSNINAIIHHPLARSNSGNWPNSLTRRTCVRASRYSRFAIREFFGITWLIVRNMKEFNYEKCISALRLVLRTSSSRYLKHYRNVIIYIIDFLINAEESLSYN